MSSPTARLFLIGHCYGAERVFGHLFNNRLVRLDPFGMEKLLMLDANDVICWGGGEDISPSLYKERAIVGSGPDTPSHRDRFEVIAFERARTKGAKMLGICRGAQMLCALNGGKLVQHVSNHGRDHWMATYDEELLRVTSVHHQMMWPYNLPKEDFSVLGWTPEPVSTQFVFNAELSTKSIDYPEPEIVMFPKTNGLAIQGHPEFAVGSEFARYSAALVSRFLLTSKPSSGGQPDDVQ